MLFSKKIIPLTVACLVASNFATLNANTLTDEKVANYDYPATLYNIFRVNIYPQDGGFAKVNPVCLKWPSAEDSKATYDVLLSQDKDFKSNVISSKEQMGCFLQLHKKMNNGEWFWKYSINSKGQSSWSKTYSFKINDNTPIRETPTVDELISNIPTKHPYLVTYGETLEHVKEMAKNFPHLVETLVQAGDDALVKDMVPITSMDKTKIASKKYGTLKIAYVNRIKDLYRAYLVTGDKKYYDNAIIRINDINKWENDSIFRYSSRMRVLVEARDVFFDIMDDELKEKIATDAANVIIRCVNKWPGRVENRQIENHVWQVELAAMFSMSIALIHEKPELKDAIEYTYNLYLNRAPVLGGEDGGWANGVAYFSVNKPSISELPYLLYTVCGFDNFEKSWYNNLAEYFIYQTPAGGPVDGFGDMHDRRSKKGEGIWVLPYLVLAKKDSKALLQLSRISKDNLKITEPWLQLLAGVPTFKDYEIAKITDFPNSRVFKDVGVAGMHTHLSATGKDLALYFRSSPYGANGHMHANQNAFNLAFKGEKVFYSSGFYTSFADPHSLTSYKHTRASNTILVDGKGQAFGHEGYGWIKRFAQVKNLSYVCGEAAPAYSPLIDTQWTNALKNNKVSKDENFLDEVVVNKFERHVALLNQNIVVIYDILEAKKPVEWSMLLHSPINTVTANSNTIHTVDENLAAKTVVFSGNKFSLNLTDKYYAEVDDFKKKYAKTPNVFHASFTNVDKTKNMRYLTIIQCGDNLEKLTNVTQDGNTFKAGKWTIVAELDSNKEPFMNISGGGAKLYVNRLPKEANGKTIKATKPASLIVDGQKDGEVILIEDELPNITNE